MIPAEQVVELLYEFLGRLRKTRRAKQPAAYTQGTLDTVLAVWAHFGDLTLEHAWGLSEPEYSCLDELLAQYVTFLVTARHLHFPPDFLAGTTSSSLGAPLRDYIAEHRWVVPPPVLH